MPAHVWQRGNIALAERINMSITIKSEKEITLMREAGKILAEVHRLLEKEVVPGVSTWEIDRKAAEFIREFGCKASFLGYNGYPASICISVNDVVIHGIPSKDRILKEGDIVSLDAGVIYKGYQSDAARTVPCGKISAEAERLIRVTRESFYEGLKYARGGNHLYEISGAVEDHVVAAGYSVVREFVGHGIGREMHEDPQIPHYHMKRRGIKLIPGMTICVEPMVNAGRCDINCLDDGWTIVTQDHSLSAHYENTILITEGEPELLSI